MFRYLFNFQTNIRPNGKFKEFITHQSGCGGCLRGGWWLFFCYSFVAETPGRALGFFFFQQGSTTHSGIDL